MQRRSPVFFSALLAAVMLVLAACGSGSQAPSQPAPSGGGSPAPSQPTPSGGSAPAPAILDPVRIGLVGIMTGPNAENGWYTSNGAKLAVDQINAAGGLQLPGESGKRQLELFVEDDQATPDVGINAIKKLVDEHKVLAFMGPDFSGITYASLFVGDESKTPQITSSISSKITREGYRYIFRGRSNDEVWMTSLIDHLVQDLGMNRIALSYTNIELGKNGADVGQKYMKEKYDLEPVVVVSHSAGDKDLSASANRVAAADPQALINWGLQIEASLLIRDLRNLSWQGVFGFQAADDIFVNLAKELAVGVIGPQNWVWTKQDDKSQRFANDFKTQFGKNPSPHSVIYYDAVYMLKDALESVGADKEKIREHLAGIQNFSGVQGAYRPTALEGGEMSTATVIIKYNQDLVPEVVKAFD